VKELSNPFISIKLCGRLRGLSDLKLDELGDRFARSIGDGEGVGGGFPGRKIEAAGMGGPNLTFGWIEGDSFGVRDVVAKLSGLAAMNDGGRNVESANGEFGAAELLDGGAIIGAALFSRFFSATLFKSAIRYAAGNKQESDIGKNDDERNRRIEIGILEEGFLWRGLRVHAVELPNAHRGRI